MRNFSTFTVITNLISSREVKFIILRPNKKINVFRVTSLKFLGRLGTYNFFSRNKYNFMPFKMHKIIFFPENLKKF